MPQIQSPQALRFVFTINNPTQCPLNHNDFHDRISHVYYTKEVGSNGTPHIQGYLELKSRSRRTWLVNNCPFLAGAFIEEARGTWESNKEYIDKSPIMGPYSYGRAKAPIQGKRNDLKEIQEAIKDGKSDWELFSEFPSVMAKYPRYVSTFRSLHLESLVDIQPFIPLPGWQSLLVEVLRQPIDRRKIHWYWSSGGNLGKSHFANHYQPTTSTVITGGKHADIYYSLSTKIHKCDVVFFDYARTLAETIPYSVMECLKNGRFTSSKYESRTLCFNPVHVVVFSNNAPDLNAMSIDRWNIVRLD